MSTTVLTDPCGNRLQVPVDLTLLLPAIPTLADLLALAGISLPTVEFDTPCPILLDRAKDSVGGAV